MILDIGLHCELRIPTDERFHPGEVWKPELGLPFLVETNRLSRRVPGEGGRPLPRHARPGASPTRSANGCGSTAANGRRRRLGESFDLKHFHRVVLDMGAMGLDQFRDQLAVRAVRHQQ